MANYDASSTNKSKRSARIFSDLDLDFTRNPVTNDVSKIEDVDAVKRSVRNLIQTNFYERPFRPELGSGVRQMLFEPFMPLTKTFLKRKIEEVLANYEPRAKIEQVAIHDEPDKNRIKATIYFYVVNSDEPVVVTTFLERLR